LFFLLFVLIIFLFLTLLVVLDQLLDFLYSSFCCNLMIRVNLIFCLSVCICSLIEWCVEFLNVAFFCCLILQIIGRKSCFLKTSLYCWWRPFVTYDIQILSTGTQTLHIWCQKVGLPHWLSSACMRSDSLFHGLRYNCGVWWEPRKP
jgi:hypothetical protein